CEFCLVGVEARRERRPRCVALPLTDRYKGPQCVGVDTWSQLDATPRVTTAPSITSAERSPYTSRIAECLRNSACSQEARGSTPRDKFDLPEQARTRCAAAKFAFCDDGIGRPTA